MDDGSSEPGGMMDEESSEPAGMMDEEGSDEPEAMAPMEPHVP